MPKLHLQCNMDRLGPDYEANKPYYLLSLSVAFATPPATKAEVKNALQPWIWPAINMLSVYKQAAAGWTEVKHHLLPAATLASPKVLTDALTAELDAQLDDFQPADFVWDAINPKPPTAWNGRKGRDWRSWVGHVGTYPGGIGTALNLTFVIVADTALDETDVVLAAPHFTIDATAYKPKDPANFLKPVTGQSGVFQWDYDGDASAFLNAPQRPVPDLSTFINIRTQWRNGLTLDGGGDWTVQLDDRLAQAFDGVERLLGWVRLAIGKAKPLPANVNELLLDAAFAIVRPAIDNASRPPMGDGLSKLPRKVKPNLPPFGSGPTAPANWKVILEKALRDAGGSTFTVETFPPDPGSFSFRDDWAMIQSQFRQPATLTLLILELWKQFFGANWNEELRKALAEELGKISQLHLHLLAHAAGPTWRGLVPDGTPAGEEFLKAKESVRQGLEAFGKTTWPAGDADWATIISDQSRTVMLPARDIPLDSTSDGLMIKVDKVETDPNDPVKDKQDYLRRITGVGVLLKKLNGPWRCLNMAHIQVLNAVSGEYNPLDTGAKAIPYRFAYSGDLRQGFIKYLNQPLVAVSPWSQLSPSRTLEPVRVVNPDQGLVRYDSPYKKNGGEGPEWLLERLVYGQKYVAAPFYFANGGSLPKELAASDGGTGKLPWSFVMPADATELPGSQGVEYLRNCPVGQLRIVEAGNFPPEVPERVYPITPVIEKSQDPADPLVQPMPANKNPLVLLIPSNKTGWNTNLGRQSVDVSLRPPALDLKVWDRCIPDDAGNATSNRERRRSVLGEAHKLRFELDAGNLKHGDATVDDPFVSGFKVSGVRLWPSTKRFNAAIAPTFKLQPATVQGLAAEQKTAIKVTVTSAAVSGPKLELDAATGVYKLSIPDGEIWHIDFLPTVPAEFQKVFVPEVINKLEPLSLVVEVARQLPKDAAAVKQLYDGLKLERVDNKLLVKLDSTQFKAFSGLIHRVEVVSQRWRWDGRPVYEIPLPTDPNEAAKSGLPFTKLGELDKFEGDGMLFSSREETDASIFPTQVEFADATLPQQATIRDIDWGNKAGVLYYRFAVRAYSRYEGLLEDPSPVDSARPASPGGPLHWKRYVRESLWSERVPKPAVKLVLPLTQSVAGVGGNRNAAGWLVVLNEPWYGEEMAGLGESLSSDLISVKLPDSLDETRAQFGPDPIIELPDDPYGQCDVVLPRPVGAIGNTFDVVSGAPLFANSSFFQSPPVVLEKETGNPVMIDLTFHFIKLRFKRVIFGIDPKDPRGRKIESEYTDGYWTQLLPPADWWYVAEAKERVQIRDLRLATQRGFLWKGNEAVIVPMGPHPQPKDSFSRFQLFALVTTDAIDVFGRSGQEFFVALSSLDKLKQLNLDERTNVRLLEVQFRVKEGDPLPISPTEPSLNDLVNLLFTKGDQGPEDAKARVVRVSPPFKISE